MSKPLYIAFWQFSNYRNLMVIDKDPVKAIEYPRDVPMRIISNFEDLDIVVEISPQRYQEYIMQDLNQGNNYAYCVTYDLGTTDRPTDIKQHVKHWYITNIEVADDLSCRFYLHRDTLREYYNNALFAINVSDTPVIITTESDPTISADLTKMTGQKIIFKEDTLEGNTASALFPYAWGSSLTGADWIHKFIFIVDIASNRADDTNASQYFIDSNAGVTTYVTNYIGLRKLVNYIATDSVFDEIKTQIISGKAGDAIIRVARSPIEFPSSALTLVNEIPVGGATYSIPLTQNTLNATFYKLTRYHWATPTNDQDGTYWKAFGEPFIFEYNVNETERIELTMPFAGKIDLSNFIEYFNGKFTVGYIIDMLTGQGMLGVVKGDGIEMGSLPTKFDVVVPIDVFVSVQWTEVQNNEIQRFYRAFDSVLSLAGGKFGGFQGLFADPTTITPHRDTENADASKLGIYGLFNKWGVKYICRAKGIKNQGFRHVRQPLKDLPVNATSVNPDNPDNPLTYNIITVECERRAWTGNTSIDNDIYQVLTMKGFVKNL